MNMHLIYAIEYVRLLSRDYHCVNKNCIRLVSGGKVIFTIRPRFTKLRRVK